MKQAIIFVLAFSLALESQAKAEDEVEQWWTQLRGTIELAKFGGLTQRNEIKIDASSRMLLRDGSGSYIIQRPRIRIDDQGLAQGELDRVPESVRKAIDFQEVYLLLEQPDVSIRVGKLQLNWARADEINPLDSLNPRDYLDLLEQEKMGAWGVEQVWWPYESLSLELVYLPYFQPSLLPRAQSEWFLPPFDQSQVKMNHRAAWQEPQYGLRTNLRHDLGDLSLSWYDGVEALPAIRLDQSGPRLVHNKTRIIGLGFETPGLGDFGARGEIGWFEGDSGRADQRLAWTVGVDRLWYDILGGRNQFYLNLQHAGEKIVEEGLDLEYPRPFTDHVTLESRFSWSDEAWQIGLEGVVGFKGAHDYYLRPSLKHRLANNFQFTMGYDWLAGEPESFFGFFEDNGRWFVNLTLEF